MDQLKRGRGRPRKAERTRLLQMRVAAEMHEFLAGVAEAEQTTMTALVESLISREMRRRKATRLSD